jgi:hypothetical protein
MGAQTVVELTVAVEVVQHQANRRRWKLLGHLTVFQLQIQVGESSVSFVRSILFANHVKWVPSHHGMSCPQVVDEGDGLQIWRIAANILNKQWHSADRVWSSSLGVGGLLKTPHCKTYNL